ncbi:hypothetical protein MKX01_001161 [Papaver californicum]|nr:hypothetical protein MKX01_001161 [Papaver californicum]
MSSTTCSSSVLAFFIILAICTPIIVSEAKSIELKVGENGVWQQPNDTNLYNHWARRNRFIVGDSLLFEYEDGDSVLVVNKQDYKNCNSTNPISAFDDGKTVFKLTKPGLIYFISGNSTYCKKGEKLIISVMTIHPLTHHQSPPSADSPSLSPTSTPTTESSSGAASVLVTPITALSAFIGALLWSVPMLY